MAFQISRDPILSKAFKDMSDAEFELAKLEAEKIVSELSGRSLSSDLRKSIAMSLLAKVARPSTTAAPDTDIGSDQSDVFKEIPEPDPFEKRDLFGENFKKVALPKEPVRSDRSSLDAKRKESSGSFRQLAKELGGRSS